MKNIFPIFLFLTFLFYTEKVSADSRVTFYTTKGNFVAMLYNTWQPITAGNFETLVNAKFYDGIIFHRVINGFMIQGGDPLGTGYGGPGYTIPDEFDPNTSNVQKALAMANSGPNTGGSQFFINLVNNLYLNPDYPVFGIVTENFSVVQSIGAVATDTNDRPLVNVVMDSVRVTNFPTGVSNHQQNNSSFTVGLYPNPVTNESAVILYSDQPKNADLTIINSFGSIVYHSTKHLLSGINKIQFHEICNGNLSNGVYFIKASTDEYVSQQKFVLEN